MEQITEQVIATLSGSLPYLLHRPTVSDRASDPALLLTFATTARSAFQDKPHDIPFRHFAEAGHYVATFDLPHHGSCVDHFGEGIEGMCQAFVAGQDPFARFIADGQAVIDACLTQGIGQNGKFVVCGVSRAGYCALRLAASDPRIRGIAALAPVTDWRRLREFAAVKEQPAVAALAIDNWVTQLADRAVYLAIGNHDDRVGTDSFLRFAHRLFEAQDALNSSSPTLPASSGRMKQMHVIDSPGHTLTDEWRSRGASFLLQTISEIDNV